METKQHILIDFSRCFSCWLFLIFYKKFRSILFWLISIMYNVFFFHVIDCILNSLLICPLLHSYTDRDIVEELGLNSNMMSQNLLIRQYIIIGVIVDNFWSVTCKTNRLYFTLILIQFYKFRPYIVCVCLSFFLNMDSHGFAFVFCSCV